MLEKEFVPYQESLELKELGFNEPCFGYYYTLDGKNWKFAEKDEYRLLDDEMNIGAKFSLLAPTFSQIFRWFREKYSLIAYPQWRIDNNWEMIIQKLDGYGLLSGQATLFVIKKPNYEEAELACIRKLIELAKK